MSPLEKLISLYGKNSKHSNYQILPAKLAKVLGEDAVDVLSRYERERFEFILENLPLAGKTVLDIGGNTGFFTFEALDAGAHSVHHFEGQADHSEFVSTAALVLDCADRIRVTSAYYDFRDGGSEAYDVVFLLNGLHHLGDDFGGKKATVEDAKLEMARCLNQMAAVTESLVFQLGFCWKGDRNCLMFPGGTKDEMVDFVTKSTQDVWVIEKVAVPVKSNDGAIVYAPMDSSNSVRDDAMGEFLNRPLFILRKK
ncbi:MAG: class I SAM-dependent methyltransferase [Woeseiaceae bacterium]